MLAQRARLLAFYAGLVYNLWKHKITTEKPNMSKELNMIFFINSGEKSSQPKNFPFTMKKASPFYRPKAILFFKNKNNNIITKKRKGKAKIIT